MGLDGKVALVTGAARGIGLAIAERLLADGARVALTDVDHALAADQAGRLGSRATALALDVTRPREHATALASVLDLWGKLDILVNNAGIAGRSAPTWELSPEEWQQVLAVDLTGVFYGCRAVLPHMLARGSGHIVNVASIAGKEGNPNAGPYSAAKAGVMGLTKAIAKEVAERGVLINCVAPAVVETELLEQMSAEHRAYMLARVPLKRAGRPQEVAALVAWLASDECSFSTGAVFDLSGGRATY